MRKLIERYFSAIVGIIFILSLPLILSGCNFITNNKQPEASISTAVSNLTVEFMGSGSSDPDGEIVSYEWDFGDGETGSGESISHSYSSEGTYIVKLTVTDDGGATDQAQISIKVSSPSSNKKPSAAISTSPDPAEGEVPFTVEFDGTGSSDPDGNIVSYEWNFGDDTTGSGSNPSHTYENQGNYKVELTVTDNNGGIDRTEVVIVANSSAENETPEAVISTDPSPAEGNIPLEVDFDGSSSSDPDGEIVSYEWNFGDPGSGESNTTTGETATHIFYDFGTFTVTLTVVDNDGATDFAEVEVTANIEPPAPPG